MKNLYFDSRAKLFNDNWQFIAPQCNTEISVTLPHSWNSTGWTYEKDDNTKPSGTGVYKKYIDGNLNGYYLKFEGVSAFCEVYINDKKVFENIGAYKSFFVKLDKLNKGINIITVKVTDKQSLKLLPENTDNVFSQSPRYKRWPIGYGSSLKAGGIWRNVYLLVNNDIYMEPFTINPNGNEFDITANFSAYPHDYSVRYTLSDENRVFEQIYKADVKHFSIKPILSVQSWPLRPHLYEFKAELLDTNGNKVQTIIQPASLMSFTIRNSDFRINNRPYFLRGQNGFPHCNIAHDTEYIEKYVSRIKEQGVEISRFHTEPPSHAWLDECDRQGIMVILEMPLHGSFGCYSYGSKEFENNALSETLAIVKEYRRHPSIVMWSMGNELIVACERDIGLAKPLFNILERWIYEVRKLDCRPVISNSNGDGANITTKSVGDVDDVHQYGGWYVENLYDLRHFGSYTIKNDMLFQPCISTESIAGYTDEEEEFFIKHNDIRQKKVVKMRLGEIKDLKRQSREYQAFVLKEYAEAMWRLRTDNSSFSGYIPFGQYTWFFKPFDKDGINPKSIWDTYKKVMGPIHVQIECFNRHIKNGGYLSGRLGLWHENVHISDHAEFEVIIKDEDNHTVLKKLSVDYHKCAYCDVSIGPLYKSGRIIIEVLYNKKKIAYNDLEYRIYCENNMELEKDVVIYDKENMLDIGGIRINNLKSIANTQARILCVGPYSLDMHSSYAAEDVYKWISNGGHVVVLEQNPGFYSENIFNTGISSAKVCQPQWSRWAMNLIKHADRMDIENHSHYMFKGINEEDLFWWNKDTFLADSYLHCDNLSETDVVISQIGNGLSDGELMPEKYEYNSSGYSITSIERKIGKGSILLTSLLIGTKESIEPVARMILNNLLDK